MKTHCANDNIQEFNAMLSRYAPEFKALAAGLYQAGLITGLRGASITVWDSQTPRQAQKMPPSANLQGNPQICKNCRHFAADPIGQGGLGSCTVYGHKNDLIWPNTKACKQYRSTHGA